MNLLQKMFKNEKVDVQVDEKVIIQEIHDSFDNAQDELLKQALSIIELHEPLLSQKAERLQKLGFASSKTVLKNNTEKKTLITSQNDADLVNYYKTSYPFLKFLKEDQLDSICKKYNLVYAPVSKYKEDVPEKNVLEIENAQILKFVDRAINRYFVIVTKPWSGLPSDLKDIVTKGFYVDSNIVKTDRFILQYAKTHGGYTGDYDDYVFKEAEIIEENLNELFIAAPAYQFDLEGLKNKALGFFSTTITVVKDPIVFRYVKGGIQVLTKWGLEASDEMLQQPILN